MILVTIRIFSLQNLFLIKKMIWEALKAQYLLFYHIEYYHLRESNTTLSTWLDCSILMSKIRQIDQLVLGNKPTAFSSSKMLLSRPRSFSETDRCASSYYICSRTYFPISSTLRSEEVFL